MKKALIFTLLILFLFNSIGYFYLFELNKNSARKEMHAIMQLSSPEFLVLKISSVANNKDFQRIDKMEFRYKGIMYDIVREIKTGQSTEFICLHDTRESRLFAGFNKVNQNRFHIAMPEQWDIIFITGPAFDMSSAFFCNMTFPRIIISLKSSMLQTWSPPPEYS
ncbi:MAG: hypothetical protein NT040_17660 [Bacteroidetes bacterium]|nr:hypothetical protein [Bacteroidota bacterium]